MCGGSSGGGSVGGGGERQSSSLNGGAARESGVAIGSSARRHVARSGISYDENHDRPAVLAHPARSRRSHGPPARASRHQFRARRLDNRRASLDRTNSLDSAETLASSNRFHRTFLPLASVKSTYAVDGGTRAFEKKKTQF